MYTHVQIVCNTNIWTSDAVGSVLQTETPNRNVKNRTEPAFS